MPLGRVRAALDAAAQTGAAPAPVDGAAGPWTAAFDPPVAAARRTAAAVLVALFEEDGEARVLLTRRSTALRSHKGEVSFPGGRLEPGEDPPAGALREAAEEVALDPAAVAVIGWLHPIMTFTSGTMAQPVVGVLAGRPTLAANPAEVERIFDVALADLLDDTVFHEEQWRVPGRPAPDSADGSFPVWFFEVEGEIVWGATARMLVELLTLVAAAGTAP